MSLKAPSLVTSRAKAPLFAALGDETRLTLLVRLSDGEQHSIASLTAGGELTRQAVTKHLRVLERVRIVRCKREGRESLYALNPKPLTELQQYLQQVSAHWDEALLRLRAFVETDE